MSLDLADADLSVFHNTYAECRAAFLACASDLGLSVRSHVHPDQVGSRGEDLAMDVTLLGPVDAGRLVVFASGIHGCEGFAGSAVQIDTMRRIADGMDTAAVDAGDVAYLFVHGLNPYGWSFGSRTNENQVDLNRNFVEPGTSPREHPLGAVVQELNLLADRQGPDLVAMATRMGEMAEIHGLEPLADAVQRGQYVQPDGVGFGGFGPEWSNRTLRAVWEEYFEGRDLIAVVDWHTGIGEYDGTTLLCFDPPGTEGRDLARRWWGADAVDDADKAYQSGSRPIYNGLHVLAALERARAAGATAVGAVIEFGTYDSTEAAMCLWIDRWLRNLPDDADPTNVRELSARTMKFFYPNEDDWKRGVLGNGQRLADQVIAGASGHR